MSNETEKKPILEVKNLRKTFPIKKSITGKVLQELVAVDNASFTLNAGETLGIVGESGCGKTTMGRTILKLHPSNGGQIIFNGEDITNYNNKQMRPIRTKMQIIFQDPYSSLPPRSTVGDILSEPVLVHNIVPKSQVKEYVMDLMEKCGLRDYYYERYPHEFSGGQRQRIAIARAIIRNPKVIIFDEATSALDTVSEKEIQTALNNLTKGRTTFIVAHRLSTIRDADRIAVIKQGRCVEIGTYDELMEKKGEYYKMQTLQDGIK